MKRRTIVDGKLKDILLLSILALTLIFAAWKIFYTNESGETATAVIMALSKQLPFRDIL